MSLSTHVLDVAQGRPAEGVSVRLERKIEDGWSAETDVETDADGRAELSTPGTAVEPGIYRLTFDTGAYHETQGVEGFYPEASVVFRLAEPAEHYHVPLLLAPWGYSTYRGS